MKVLVDTHIFVWLLRNTQKLSMEQKTVLLSPKNQFFLSSISIAELRIKSSIGKFQLDFNPEKMALESGLELLDFSAGDSSLLESLPFHHKDPFDRMLISQAMNRNLSIMTSDSKFALYDCKLTK